MNNVKEKRLTNKRHPHNNMSNYSFYLSGEALFYVRLFSNSGIPGESEDN